VYRRQMANNFKTNGFTLNIARSATFFWSRSRVIISIVLTFAIVDIGCYEIMCLSISGPVTTFPPGHRTHTEYFTGAFYSSLIKVKGVIMCEHLYFIFFIRKQYRRPVRITSKNNL